jgi:hypothetical protein
MPDHGRTTSVPSEFKLTRLSNCWGWNHLSHIRSSPRGFLCYAADEEAYISMTLVGQRVSPGTAASNQSSDMERDSNRDGGLEFLGLDSGSGSQPSLLHNSSAIMQPLRGESLNMDQTIQL